MNKKNSERFMRCFQLARKVVHFYNMYLDGVSDVDRVHVENIERVIQRITTVEIVKKRLLVKSNIYRGYTERYKDIAYIYVLDGQDIEWEKYTSIKEMCHVLYDTAEDFQPDPQKTIQELLQGVSPFSYNEMSAARVSEELAEVLALELIYPVEFREADADFLANGGDISVLVARRQVPAVHIESATRKKYIETCKTLWEHVAATPQDARLDPFKEE